MSGISFKTCGKCGQLLPDNARVGSTCPRCGARFGSEKLSFRQWGGGRRAREIPNSVFIIILVAVLLAGAIGISYNIRHRKDEARNATLGYSHGWSRSFKDYNLYDTALSPDGKYAAAAMRSTVALLDASTGKILAMRSIADASVESIRFDLEGSSLALNYGKGRTLLDLALKETEEKAFIPEGPVLYSSDGSTAYVGLDGDIGIYDRRSRSFASKLKGGNNMVRVMALSKDGKKLAAAERARVRVWDLTSGRLAWTKASKVNLLGSIEYLGFDGESRKLYSGDGPDDCEVWDASTGAALGGEEIDLFEKSVIDEALYIPSTGVIAVSVVGLYFYELYGLNELDSPVETTWIGAADRGIRRIATDAAGNLLCGTDDFNGGAEGARPGLVYWKALPAGRIRAGGSD